MKKSKITRGFVILLLCVCTVFCLSACDEPSPQPDQVFPEHEHVLVSREAKAPTCTANGWDAYVECSECDYTTYQEKSALGHNFENRICTICKVYEYSQGLQYKTDASGAYCIVEDIGSCMNTEIIIPEEHNGFPVKIIGDGAFEDCSMLTGVVIPDSVITIGENAFHGCSSLASVTFGASVTEIKESAFYGCSALTDITLPDSVTEIGDFTFSGCSSLASITVGKSVVSIGLRAFHNCDNVERVYIENLEAFSNAYSDEYPHPFQYVKNVYYNGEAIENPFYIPSIAVMFIIDVSASMNASTGIYEESRLFWTLQAVQAGLDALTARDFVGITTTASEYSEELTLISRSERSEILGAIERIENDAKSGNFGREAAFSNALVHARGALSAFDGVDEKYVIVLTDGGIGSQDVEEMKVELRENANRGIASSFVCIQSTAAAGALIKSLLTEYAGVDESFCVFVQDIADAPHVVREAVEQFRRKQ